MTLWDSFAVFSLYSEIRSRFSPFQFSKAMLAVTQFTRKHRHLLSMEISDLTVEDVLRNDTQMLCNDDSRRFSSDKRESAGVYLCGPKQAGSRS